jgi:hypothetical protein
MARLMAGRACVTYSANPTRAAASRPSRSRHWYTADVRVTTYRCYEARLELESRKLGISLRPARLRHVPTSLFRGFARLPVRWEA